VFLQRSDDQAPLPTAVQELLDMGDPSGDRGVVSTSGNRPSRGVEDDIGKGCRLATPYAFEQLSCVRPCARGVVVLCDDMERASEGHLLASGDTEGTEVINSVEFF